MNEADDGYWLLSDTSTIEETRSARWKRHLPVFIGLRWLRAAWRDLWTSPGSSLAYGLGTFAASVALITFLFATGRDYILFPATAGFMIVGPLFAIGLYQKSRDLEAGERTTLTQMLLARPKSGAQIFFTGLLLCLLMLTWMRAAVLIYALFFGVTPFPGLDGVVEVLLSTPAGWAMLAIGTAIGGLFAALAFSTSVFSIPLLLDQRTDALTAMGTSMALVWNNLVPMIVWGAIVLALFALSAATGLIALIVVYPLLGHATWHAYRSVVRAEAVE